MLFVDFLRWWYGPGWALRVKMLGRHLRNMAELFSFGTLFKTLLSPWRQNVTIARADQSIGDKFSALIDNGVSRLVGFFVRIFMAITALITLILVFVLNLIYVLIWPLIPLSPAILLAVGATV